MWDILFLMKDYNPFLCDFKIIERNKLVVEYFEQLKSKLGWNEDILWKKSHFSFIVIIYLAYFLKKKI